jgi:hypothetical protein
MTLTVQVVVADSYTLGVPKKIPFERCSLASLFICLTGLVPIIRVSALVHQRLVPTPDRNVTEDTRRK